MLRLSLAAYRLGRVVVVAGICSVVMWACRGTVAGAVHATIELRALLLEWAEETNRCYHLVSLTLYVDDASLEAAGQAAMVSSAIINATRHFASRIQAMGMEFSPTKNCCIASRPFLARSIARALPDLSMKAEHHVKSLGGGLGGGRRRNASILKERLQQFQKRKAPFRRLRRAVGARRAHAVLRTGGTTSLVYGQGNTGVATTMLLNQRRAVAASSVACGAGDLDLTLVLADGSMTGRADPAFAAHDAPIGKWAEAVWSHWLPRAALDRLTRNALALAREGAISWGKVCGPAAAFVASALRLGWHVIDSQTLITDNGLAIDLLCDSPAFVTAEGQFGDGAGGDLNPSIPA